MSTRAQHYLAAEAAAQNLRQPTQAERLMAGLIHALLASCDEQVQAEAWSAANPPANKAARPERPEPGWSLGRYTLGQLRDQLAGVTTWDLSTSREDLERLIAEAHRKAPE
jgi:hypothetical protein